MRIRSLRPWRSVVFTLFLLAGVAHPAAAADKGGKSSAEGQYINVSPIAAPIVLNGRLINYIFVTVRLDLASNQDMTKWRDKEPYFRDALVRAAHRKPFVKAWDFTHVDEAALKAVMMAESERIAGPHVVTQVEILAAQPKTTIGLPKAPATPAAAKAPVP